MKDSLQELIDLEKSGYRATAVRRLRDYLRQHRDDSEGWYYLARFAIDPYEQKMAIETALQLRPDYPDAVEFHAILLEEHPELQRATSRRGCLLLVTLGILAALSVAGVGFMLSQPTEPEVIIVVPSPSPSTDAGTVVSLLVTSTPHQQPTIPSVPTDQETRTIPTLEIQQASTDSVGTPLPIASQTLLLASDEPRPGATGIILIGFDSAETEELTQLATQAFPYQEVFIQTVESPDLAIADLLGQEAASLAIERTPTGVTLYGRDYWQVYRNQLEYMPLMRWPSPWQLTLEEPAPSTLIGVMGYVAYRPQVAIEGLRPLYQRPPVGELSEAQTILAFMLAYSYQATNQPDSASDLYDLLTTYLSDPIPAIAANRAYAIAQIGNYQSAITLYGNLMGDDPAFIQSNIGDIYWQLGSNPEAAQLAYDEAMRLDPQSPRPYLGRGRLLASLGDSQRALADFSQAIQLDGTYAAAYIERAKLTSDPQAALRDVGLAISIQPQIADYYLLQGQLLIQQGSWELAATALESALQMGGDFPEVHTALAQSYYALGNLDGAIRESNAALSLAVGFAPAWLVRGQAYLAQNELGSALNDLNQGLGHDPQNADLFAARCSVHARLGDDGAAASDCDSALALEGQHAGALEQRGMIRYRAGDRAGAQSDFLEAVTYDPNSYFAHYYLGFFALQEGRYPEAINYLSLALETAPYLGQAYAARGVAYRISGEWDLALNDLEAALELQPDDIYSYYELGLVKRFLADQAHDSGDNVRAGQLYQESADALLIFLNGSQPQDQFVPAATEALAYVQNALLVLNQ